MTITEILKDITYEDEFFDMKTSTSGMGVDRRIQQTTVGHGLWVRGEPLIILEYAFIRRNPIIVSFFAAA